MRHRIVGVSLAIALSVCGVVAAEDLKSGPQVGSSKIPAFNVKNLNGPDAGKSLCLV